MLTHKSTHTSTPLYYIVYTPRKRGSGLHQRRCGIFPTSQQRLTSQLSYFANLFITACYLVANLFITACHLVGYLLYICVPLPPSPSLSLSLSLSLMTPYLKAREAKAIGPMLSTISYLHTLLELSFHVLRSQMLLMYNFYRTVSYYWPTINFTLYFLSFLHNITSIILSQYLSCFLSPFC